MKWELGRQGTGYFKKKLVQFGKYFDAYLIAFPPYTKVPYHTDKVSERNHYRLNIYLKVPSAGGIFQVGSTIYSGYLGTRPLFDLFRPDTQPHMLSEVKEGELLILSFGWTTKNED